MEYQSFGRPQKPKGANIKQVLKVMLVLAVCAWLVYQIKNSRNNNTDEYGGQTKLVGHGAILLGRKGVPSWMDEKALPGSRNVDSVGEAKESNNSRAAERFGYIYEQFRTSEEKELELELESQPKVSSKKKYTDSSKRKSGKDYAESRRSESGHKEHGNEKYPKRPVINGSKSNDKEKEVLALELPNDVQLRKNAKLNFSAKENVEEKETKMQKNEEESVTDAGVTEEINEVQIFHDENGVPPDGNEILVGHAHILQEENISDVSNSKGSWLEMILEGLKTDRTTDEEINMGIIAHVDTTGITQNSEMDEGDSLVL